MWEEENDTDERQEVQDAVPSMLLLQKEKDILRHSWESPGKEGKEGRVDRVGTGKATQAYQFLGLYKAKQEIVFDEDGWNHDEGADSYSRKAWYVSHKLRSLFLPSHVLAMWLLHFLQRRIRRILFILCTFNLIAKLLRI